MDTFQWIKLLGATGYIMVAITTISGLRGVPVKNHKRMAWIAVILITLHAILLIIK